MTISGNGLKYETVAAGQTAQVLGGTGSKGDFLSHVVFQPTTLAPGTCTVSDDSGVIYTLTGGALVDLRPITFAASAFSINGPWKVTTGANITATAFGDFTV